MASRPRLPSTKLVTAKGLAHFAYINKPDTEGQYSDGKFKVTISYPADHPFVAELNQKVDALMAQQWGNNIPSSAHNPVKIGDETNMDAMQGRVFIRAKSNKAPIAVDAQKNKLPEGLTVFGGDTVKAAVTLAVYDGAQKGVTLYLDAIQLIEKRGSGEGAADAFGVEDGFVADAIADASADFDDDDDL